MSVALVPSAFAYLLLSRCYNRDSTLPASSSQKAGVSLWFIGLLNSPKRPQPTLDVIQSNRPEIAAVETADIIRGCDPHVAGCDSVEAVWPSGQTTTGAVDRFRQRIGYQYSIHGYAVRRHFHDVSW